MERGKTFFSFSLSWSSRVTKKWFNFSIQGAGKILQKIRAHDEDVQVNFIFDDNSDLLSASTNAAHSLCV